MRRLPEWLAGGPEVSDLAYRVVVAAFDDPPRRPRGGVAHMTVDRVHGDIGAVVEYLAGSLDVDEGDVLRALAELERVGVLEPS